MASKGGRDKIKLVSTADTVTMVVAMLEGAVATMRGVHDQIDEEDPTTADILHGFIEKLEQYAWMVDAENMEPTATVTKPAKA